MVFEFPPDFHLNSVSVEWYHCQRYRSSFSWAGGLCISWAAQPAGSSVLTEVCSCWEDLGSTYDELCFLSMTAWSSIWVLWSPAQVSVQGRGTRLFWHTLAGCDFKGFPHQYCAGRMELQVSQWSWGRCDLIHCSGFFLYIVSTVLVTLLQPTFVFFLCAFQVITSREYGLGGVPWVFFFLLHIIQFQPGSRIVWDHVPNPGGAPVTTWVRNCQFVAKTLLCWVLRWHFTNISTL